MATATALFESRAQAETAIRALRDRGIPADNISVVMRDPGEASDLAADTGLDATATGAVSGGILGGLGGLLLGLGALAIPGIGPIVAAGPLAAALGGAAAGAAAGGLLGALVDLGIPEEEAEVYRSGVERGAILVAVQSDNDEGHRIVRDMLAQYSRPIEEHRRLWNDDPNYEYYHSSGASTVTTTAAGMDVDETSGGRLGDDGDDIPGPAAAMAAGTAMGAGSSIGTAVGAVPGAMAAMGTAGAMDLTDDEGADDDERRR